MTKAKQQQQNNVETLRYKKKTEQRYSLNSFSASYLYSSRLTAERESEHMSVAFIIFNEAADSPIYYLLLYRQPQKSNRGPSPRTPSLAILLFSSFFFSFFSSFFLFLFYF